MADIFTQKFTENGSIDEEAVSTESLNNYLAELDSQIKDCSDRQETTLRNLEAVMNQINTAKGPSSSTELHHTQKVQALSTAANAYLEIKKHLQEGTKFYNDLTEMLLKTQAGISDFVSARKIEADELVKNLGDQPQKSSSAVPSSAPPARPPPPNLQNLNLQNAPTGDNLLKFLKSKITK